MFLQLCVNSIASLAPPSRTLFVGSKKIEPGGKQARAKARDQAKNYFLEMLTMGTAILVVSLAAFLWCGINPAAPIKKAIVFYVRVPLPDLFGRWFIRPAVPPRRTMVVG